MRKVMTIVGTRPELIKMCRVISLLDKQTHHVLVHTGQNFDRQLNDVFFEDLEIRAPDHYLGAAADTPIGTIAQVLLAIDALLDREKPEAVLIYGDTNSGLAVMAAKRRKIPVFHMEAGNRCFDQRVPEELNRKVIDHLADVNMTLTEHARRYLLAEGLPPALTFKVGSHMAEVIEHFRPKIMRSDVLARLGLQERGYFLVSSHREENVDDPRNLGDLFDSLNALAATYDRRVIVSTHPRTAKKMRSLDGIAIDPRISFLPPFGFLDYVRLQMSAACVVSDSGTITEESSLLGFPAVTIRQTHERPEGMDEGTLIMCGLGRDAVIDAVRFAMETATGAIPAARPVSDYTSGPVSRKVVAIVLSYIDYVNRVVWHKS